MSVSRPGEAFDDGGDDTDDSDVPPGLEESMVEESIASGLPELIFSSSEDIHLWLLQPVAVAAGGCCSRWAGGRRVRVEWSGRSAKECPPKVMNSLPLKDWRSLYFELSEIKPVMAAIPLLFQHGCCTT